MEKRSLVSIVTPCYNTGKYIHRLLESVLEQTYPSIEMFVIDDGSTDNSGDIVQSYMPRFETRGYRLYLIKQKNSGQSVAIRKGLKLVHGKYLAWPDSDDFYASSKAVEIMVNKLEELGDDYAVVRVKENLLEDRSLKIIGCNGQNAPAESEKRKLFEDCLFCINNFFFCAGACVVDFQKLKEVTSLDIYTNKNAGQNWQLMLPLLYNYKCYTIQAPLYNVVVRLSSHSRGQYVGYERTLAKITSYEQTILETIKKIHGMPEEEKDRYSIDIKKKYCKERLMFAFEYRKKDEFEIYYKEAKRIGCKGSKELILKTFFHMPIIVKGAFYIMRLLTR